MTASSPEPNRLRSLWPLRRPPATPAPPDAAAPDPISWQRFEPVEAWMTATTEPRMPTPVSDQRMETPVTEPEPELEQERVSLPDPPPPSHEPCQACRGTGHAPTVNDHLRASIAVVADDADEVVIDFYERLFQEAPTLRVLFPPDLMDAAKDSNTRGFAQRDELVRAMVSVANGYDPFNPKAMAALDVQLQTMGRRHHSFALPNGGVLVPRRAHYDVAVSCLLQSLRAASGPRWCPEFEAAWDEAMEHVTDSMRHYARLWRSGFARLPRQSADPTVSRRRLSE